MNNLQELFNVTEVDLVYRNRRDPENRISISSPEDAHDVLRKTWDENKIGLLEQAKILLLDNWGTCLGISEISSGGMTACIVDPKIVFATALKAKATKIILSHNHPSGSLEPSKEDIALTARFVEAGKVLDLPVIDHMILTPASFYSFATNGLMP
jgi:DNA repair protein RadC